MLLYLLSPAIIFRRRSFNNRHMIYILLMLIMVLMAHAATARVILLSLHCFDGFDECLPQVRTAILDPYLLGCCLQPGL